ncbi:MAG: zinc-binding dehydrogenase [Sedimentisphaeraceae bacterium JB056]
MYKTCKAIIIQKPLHAEVKEIKLPEVTDESIVIRTFYSAISSGTEVKTWNGKTGKLGGELWYPLVPGYEQVGIVEYVGPKAKMKTALGEDIKVGDRVMSNEIRNYPDYCAAWGGQVEISVKNSSTAPSPFDMPAIIPEKLSFQDAVVCYLAAVAQKGINKVGIKEGETVIVTGMGAVGLSALQLAKLAGAKTIAIDKGQWKSDRVKSIADHVICHNASYETLIPMVADITKGRMADVVIEATGDSKVINNLRKLTRDGGWEIDDDGARVHLQGDYPEPVCLTPYQEWFNRNLRLSMSCALRAGDKESILKLASEGKFNTDILWDKEVPLEQAPFEYADIENNRDNRMKTLIKWN